MSGVLPLTVQGPNSAKLTTIQPTRVSISHSLKRQARTSNAQRWGLQFSWNATSRAVFMQFYAFLLSQRGQSDTFTTTMPGHTAPQGSWAGAPVVAGAGQTGRTVNLSGFTINQTGVAKAGDLVQFAGHTKVYMVTADANSSATGTATVSIEPALMTSPANLAALATSNIPFTVALASDTVDTALGASDTYSWSIAMIEVF